MAICTDTYDELTKNMPNHLLEDGRTKSYLWILSDDELTYDDKAKKFNDLRLSEDYAYLDLTGINLSDQIIYYDLHNCCLDYADLSHSNLSKCDISNSSLRYANLKNTGLEYGYYHYCDLSNSDLTGANLVYATFENANLTNTILDYQIEEGLLEKVAHTILNRPDRFDMKYWHIYYDEYNDKLNECNTIHCIAGWAVTLSNKGKQLEKELHSTELAGLLLLGNEAHSHFFDSNEQAITWLKSIVNK